MAPKLVTASRLLEKVVRYDSHVKFLNECINCNAIPKGMMLKFAKDALPKSEYLVNTINNTIHTANVNILYDIRNTYQVLLSQAESDLQHLMYELFQTSEYSEFEHIYRKLQNHRSALQKKYLKKKKTKMEKILQNTQTQNTAVTKRTCRRFKRKQTPTNTQNPQPPPDVVINLSNHDLTPAQKELLTLGPKFCPTPRTLDHYQLKLDVKEGCRRVRLKELFADEEDRPAPKFYKKTGFQPPTGRDRALDTYCATLESLTDTYRSCGHQKDNLKHDLHTALQQLRQLVLSRTIRVSRADKGGAIVLQDTEDYITEANRQLNNQLHYKKLPKDPTTQIAEISNKLVEQLHSDGHIDDNTKQWALVEHNKCRTHQFYHLPKIHKTLQNPPGRPIVSGVNGPTETLSKLVDFWLQDIVTALPSHVKDTTHMLRTIRDWNLTHGPFNNDTLLVTIDVVGLYTNIPHRDMETAISHFLQSHPQTKAPPVERVLEIVRHILQNNVFQFENTIFKQEFGTAMGTPMAPTVANLFMGWLEDSLLTQSPIVVDSRFWKRFIDDIFLLWTKTQEDLDQFITFINSFHPTVKFTHQSSPISIPFLDINIILKEGFLHTDLYSKPTDAHAYLHASSCHPKTCKENIPFSQMLRARRLCSTDDTFTLRCREIAQHFQRRGYSAHTIQKAIERASSIPRNETLEYRPKTTTSRVPFIITHNPANPPLRQWLQQQQPALHDSDRMRQAMPELPVVGERNTKSLRNILMPSMLPPPEPPNDDPGSHRCTRKRCVVCREHVVEARQFTSDTTGETFTIRHEMSCSTRNIVYLLYCSKCKGAQYVGETRNSLKQRFYLHRSHIQSNTGTHVTHHFNMHNHSLQDMRCMPIEKQYTDSEAHRDFREKFWIRKMQTKHPHGLNTHN